MTEKELDRAIRMQARFFGLLAYHTQFSIGSAPGFPDWVIAGPGGILYRECKTAGGQLSPAQQRWRYQLLTIGCDWAIWKPDDLLSGRIAREMEAIRNRAAQKSAFHC